MAVYLSEDITHHDLRRYQPAGAATEIGAEAFEPPATLLGLALILAPWAAGVVGFALYVWLG